LISSEEVYQEQGCSSRPLILLKTSGKVISHWVQGDTWISMTNQQIISKEALEADTFEFRSPAWPHTSPLEIRLSHVK